MDKQQAWERGGGFCLELDWVGGKLGGGVYGRVAKISNAVGRSDYITDEKRQEEIVLHKENMQHSWEEHSAFEKAHQKTNVANNEVR